MKTNIVTQQKLRGGYYTPPPIAEFLIDWATNGNMDVKILEPSMGDGVFLELLSEKLSNKKVEKHYIGKNIWGVELFKAEQDKAKAKLKARGFKVENYHLLEGDFFSNYRNILSNEKFDVVLGNPPFIRYQDFPEEQRDLALQILNEFGFHPNKLTNAWLFFLLLSVNLLNDKGKFAMVVPAELLQVKYAAEARVFLSKFFNSITIVSFKKLVFEGIQQEILLLLGDKSKSQSKGIDLIELNDISDLRRLGDKIKSPEHFKPIIHSSDKWLQYFLSKEEILLLRDLASNPKLTKLGKLIEVDVGVVTGNNDYFVMNNDTVAKYKLNDYVLPLVGRTEQLNGGVIFNKSDWNESEKKGNKNYLLSYQLAPTAQISKGLREYIQFGEALKIHEGYKCRIRKIWYVVPSVWTPDAFLFRQIHQYPKLVLNNAKAIPTDTIHRVKIKANTKTKLIISSFLNSLTFAFSEIYGRSYGGGVLELEPNEAEEIFVPYFPDVELDLEYQDKLTRTKDINKVLDYTDKILLSDRLALSNKQIASLRNIWMKLSNRRTGRK